MSITEAQPAPRFFLNETMTDPSMTEPTGTRSEGFVPDADSWVGAAPNAGAVDVAETVQLHAEELTLSTRQVHAGTVKVSTRTEVHEEIAEISLARTVVEVERVPVGRIVEVAPTVRTDGDTTIVPVVEERFVVVKQLFLKEELHLRSRVDHEVSRTPVTLRRQTAIIERVEASGSPAAHDTPI